MAKLYYYYGAMGSSKTANALMTHFNYEEVGQKALLCKPAIDARDGERTVYSRIGLQHDCILLEELQQMKEEEKKGKKTFGEKLRAKQRKYQDMYDKDVAESKLSKEQKAAAKAKAKEEKERAKKIQKM